MNAPHLSFPFYGTPKPKPMNAPWICPRCGTVNAWWVARCRCKPPSMPRAGESE